MLFLAALYAFCFSKSTLWNDVGCNDGGLLSPSRLPKVIAEADPGALSTFLRSDHPVAQSGCYGSHTVKSEPRADRFHLLWECYDRTQACLLPSVNIRTLKTLLHFHPTSKVIIWSNTLQSSLLEHRISHPNLQLRHYGQRLFDSLPLNAREAYARIPKYFSTNVESQSHFSDLFRLAVLWRFGGVYVDFDSLWVDSVGELSTRDEWIPITRRKLQGFPLIKGDGFLEGGIMKLQRNSLFAQKALATFPEYTDEVAQCWACVGPKHLTDIFIQLSEDPSVTMPDLVDSSLVYGNDYFRANLDEMFSSGVDFTVLSTAAATNAVAFHLFTSSGEHFVKPLSTIDILFKISDAQADLALEHVPLGALSQRRRTQENSLTYEIIETVEFDANFDVEIRGREIEFCTAWEETLGTSCISVAKGSVIVTHGGSASQMEAVNAMIEANDGVDLSAHAFRYFTLTEPDDSDIDITQPPPESTDSPIQTTEELSSSTSSTTEVGSSTSSTTEVVDAQTSTSDDSGGKSLLNGNMALLFFCAVGGIILVVAFYCMYRFWKGPDKAKNLKYLNDSHVQYISGDSLYSTNYSTPASPPPKYLDVNPALGTNVEVENETRATQKPYSSSWEGGYQKRSPQSSYIKEDTGGYLVSDTEEEVYGYKPPQQDYGGSSSNTAYYDYENGIVHNGANIGGAMTDDAFVVYGKRRPDTDPRRNSLL